MTTGTVPVVAIVVATRGDARLARALASVGWAAERVVLDPAGRVDATALPAGVERVGACVRLDDVGRAPWALLLREDEVAPPALQDAVADAIALGAPRRVRRELGALDAAFLLRRAPLRLAPRAGGRIVVARGLELALRPRYGPTGALEPLAPVLAVTHAASLVAALEGVDADGAMAAALLEASGRRPRVRDLLWSPCVAATRVLVSKARRPAGMARWVVAVLVAYRAVVAHAKLWERMRDHPVELA